MNKIIEVLKKHDLFKRSKPNYSSIDLLTISKFVDINKEIGEIIKQHQRPVNNALSSFAAEPNLGGGSLECGRLQCRLNRIDKLSRYALLYSDVVYIDNFFDKHLFLKDKKYFKYAKEGFYNDLQIFNYILPLLEKGIIKIYSPDTTICFACQTEELMGEQGRKKFKMAQRKVKDDIYDILTVNCTLKNNNYYYKFEGIEKYFEHGRIKIFHDASDSLKKRKSMFEKIQMGEKTQLSKSLIKDLGFYNDVSQTFIHNVIFGLSSSFRLNTSFLTASEQQLKFINSLNPNDSLKENNILSEKYLSSSVPFLEDVSIVNLIKLRNRESESFINYKAALNESILHYKEIKGKWTPVEAKQFYYDVLEPKLAELNIKANKAKMDLINKPLRSIVGIVGVISFGLISKIFPSDVSNIVSVLGMAKFGSDLIKDTIAIDDKESSIQDDKYYFLWKVKKLAKK
jgi:hypothetical protein